MYNNTTEVECNELFSPSQIVLGKNITFLDKIGKSKNFRLKALEDEWYMHLVCHNQLYIKAI